MRLLLLLLVLLVGGGNIAMAEELTVANGTNDNSYVPIYGNWADAYLKCEFVIPAADLAAMNGSSVSAMKFYLKSLASKKWTGTFQIFLKEVDNTAMSDFLGTDDATVVYEGQLDGTSSTIEVNFTENYTYNGGNLLVGVYQTEKGAYASASFYGVGQNYNAAVSGYNSTSLSGISATGRAFIPKTTFTYEAAAEGPALKVKEYKNGETCAFGMVNPSATKTITLANPGTEEITVNIATTGGFTTDMASATIAAKGEQVVTITAPDATATGTITITPTATGVDAITINLSCTIKDPNKMFVDFNDNALPEGWTTVGIGSYTTGSYASSYTWDFSKGYAWYKSTSSSAGYVSYYYHSLVSPLVKFTEGEKLIFKVKKEVSYSSYLGYVRVDYTTDGSTWTAVTDGTFADADLTTEWAEKEVTIPASAKQIRFVAAGIALDDIYGGELSQAPVMKVTASDYAFGMISADAQTTFTIENTGKSELTGVQVASSDANFTISGDYATVAAGETATVTVTMSSATKGSHSGVITVTAPDQETATFNVSGYVMDDELFTETFEGNALPDGWTNTGWTFANGEATGTYSSTKKQLITPSLTVADGEVMAIEAQKTRNSGCAMDIYVSKDGGEFTKHQTIADADMENGTYKVFFIEGLEAGSYKIRFDANDNKINAVNGFHLDQNAPAFEMVTTGAAAFGKKTANDSKTYTVKNAGTGTLTVNIASDNATDFSVAPAQLSIAAGETADFTITFNYTEGSFGNKTANITVTPTYNESLVYTIAATAKAMDPNAWDEDFEEGTMPTGWVADKWTVGTQTYTTNPNNTKLAYSTTSGVTLVTPRLHANANDVLMWEAYFDWYDEGIKVEVSSDEQETWSVVQIDGLTLGTATTGSLANAYVPKDNGFTLSPNPTSGIVRIEGITAAETMVCDVLGQLLKTAQNTNEIDLKGLPQGVYLLRVTDEKGATATRKVVVE